MRFTKSIPVLLILIFTLLLPNSVVEAKGNSFIGVSTVYEKEKGKEVEIGIFISSNEHIAGGLLELYYDKTALKVDDPEIGELLPKDSTSVNINHLGKISLAWAGAVGQAKEGTMLTFTAELKKANEAIDLQLQNVKLFGEDGETIPVEVLSGAVKPFNGVEEKYESEVKDDKKWTIEFSHDLNPSTVNRHTVVVKDKRGKWVDVNVRVEKGNTVIVTPKKNYSRGTHTLEITEQVRTKNGTLLKEPVQFEFSVE